MNSEDHRIFPTKPLLVSSFYFFHLVMSFSSNKKEKTVEKFHLKQDEWEVFNFFIYKIRSTVFFLAAAAATIYIQIDWSFVSSSFFFFKS